jgi:hypothetical protein
MTDEGTDDVPIQEELAYAMYEALIDPVDEAQLTVWILAMGDPASTYNPTARSRNRVSAT